MTTAAWFDGTVEDLALAHDSLRPLMFSLAYRMLGSVAEAEDVVQDAFLRMHDSIRKGTHVESPDAFATTVTSRLAIDALRSARHRRERYVGTWLPEPLLEYRRPGSRRPGRDAGDGLDGVPGAARAAQPAGARGLPAARGVRLRLRRHRRDRRQERGQLSPGARSCPQAHRRGATPVRALAREAPRAVRGVPRGSHRRRPGRAGADAGRRRRVLRRRRRQGPGDPAPAARRHSRSPGSCSGWYAGACRWASGWSR